MLAVVGTTPASAVTPAALPLTLASAVSCGAFSTENGALGNQPSARVLKTEAILGGAPSALERIRMTQAIPGPDESAGLAHQGAAPRTDTCPASARLIALPAPQRASIISIASAEPAIAGQRDDVFLSSPRIAIGRTRFDADWSRVQSVHLSAARLERSMGAAPADRLGLIAEVNRWANETVTYRPDAHGGDYWADARQTLRRKTGDCEDIAILKYQALLSLGVSPADMYFTLAHDLVRHADHALLVVRHEGRYLLLDNSTDALLDGAQSNDYRPIVSFGEGKWLHGIETAPQPAVYLSRNELSSPRVIGLIK